MGASAMTHETPSAPEIYRLLYLYDGIADERTEFITASDDADALKLAWTKIGFKSVPIEIWVGNRLVGRIDPPTW